MAKLKKQTMILDSKKALIHSANKLNRSMPEVFRGCGKIGDKKYNRKKEKRVAQKEMQSNMGDFFNSTKLYSICGFINVLSKCLFPRLLIST